MSIKYKKVSLASLEEFESFCTKNYTQEISNMKAYFMSVTYSYYEKEKTK